MQKLLFYNQSKQIIPKLIDSLDKDKKAIIISPNPNLADLYRSAFIKQGFQNFDSITISKYRKDCLSMIGEQNLEERLYKKSKLMIFLSVLWQKEFPQHSLSVFQQSFNLFTELRSSTVDIEMFREIHNEFHPAIAESIVCFWRIVDQLEIIDEHSGYFMIAQAYRDLNSYESIFKSNEGNSYIFIGFQFMSGSQIDLVKALSIYHDVFIPIRKDTFDKSMNTDWVNWLDGEHEYLDVKSINKNKKVSIKQFPKNSLNNILRKNNLSALGIDKLVLGSKRLDYKSILDIPGGSHFFKIQSHLFSPYLAEVIEQIKLKFFNRSEKNEIQKILEHLDLRAKKALEEKNFKVYKCLCVLHNVITYWQGLSQNNNEVSLGVFQIISEASELDLPRVFSVPVFDIENSISILSLGDGITLDEDQKVAICLASKFGAINSKTSVYPENVSHFLAAIGPVRRAEFEFEALKYDILEMINRNEVFLFVESGYLESSYEWNEILKELNVEHDEKSQEYDKREFKEKDIEAQYELSSISATKLQTYIDCPRKFYFKYVENSFSYPKVKTDMQFNELGTVEHKVIEEYFKESASYDLEVLKSVTNRVVAKYFAINKKELQFHDYEEVKSEVELYSGNAIKLLCELKEKIPSCKLRFECPIKKEEDGIIYGGSLDCLVEVNNLNILIDFKRSKSSIPNFQKLLNLEKIQLPFYLRHGLDKKVDMVGYLCMANMEDSLFIGISEKFNDDAIVSEYFSFANNRKISDSKSYLVEFEDLEKQIIDKIRSETKFLPFITDSSSCDYCRYSMVCTRGIE